jgi:hypothetical protein
MTAQTYFASPAADASPQLAFSLCPEFQTSPCPSGTAADASPQLAISLAGAAQRLAAAGRAQAALAAAQGISMPRLQGAILANLAPWLPDDLLETALRQARAMPDAWARSAALAGLLPRLPPAHRQATVEEIVAAARSLEWMAGEVIVRDAARALAAAGDAGAAGHLLATMNA